MEVDHGILLRTNDEAMLFYLCEGNLGASGGTAYTMDLKSVALSSMRVQIPPSLPHLVDPIFISISRGGAVR